MRKTVKAKRSDRLTKKSTKKYVTRSSPSYSANEHCGKVKKGNDGKMYISTPDKNNICRWKKLASS
jgi:glucose/arabinose dehydrogenase